MPHDHENKQIFLVDMGLASIVWLQFWGSIPVPNSNEIEDRDKIEEEQTEKRHGDKSGFSLKKNIEDNQVSNSPKDVKKDN